MLPQKRDWELVPISKALGSRFGYDIFPTEFKKITGDLSLVKLSDPVFLRAKAATDPRAPIIRKGAEITNEIVKTFLKKNCTVLPILVEKPIHLDALSNFARKQTLLLAGRVFSCVEDWLEEVRKERSVSVLQTIRKFRKPLLHSLNNALKDWEAVTVTLVNDILVAKEHLSILSLFDDFIGNPKKQDQQRDHSMEVTVLALMIGRKCNLQVPELKDLGLAGLIHDIGMVVYEQKLQELMHQGGQVLEPDIIRLYYDKHPIYGALLLSKKDGAPIAGVSPGARMIVIEHEQKIDGSAPRIRDAELQEELQKMDVPDNVVFIGHNRFGPDLSRPQEMHFPGKDLVKRYTAIPSQVLHIAETYVTLLDRFKRRKLRDPHKEVLRIMLKQAGQKLNGQIFEVFFNYLIPPDYYPENLVVTLNTRKAGLSREHIAFHNHIGVIIGKEDEKGKIRKHLRLIKKPDGQDMQQKVSFDLNEEKQKIYLQIDDWNRYRN